ncbi:MAG TPA: DUF4350 domain-containing protein [Bryobacteraceae bacterium]|jgi:hypothetical protein|nr:DUF4350 domain-containing protein [Bryobacteraceae bacterium]
MRNRLALIGGLVLIAIFLITLTVSVLDRAEGTSAYPAYSSLNNGDEGLKAYYDALGRLGFVTSRNYLPLHKIAGTAADVVYAGPTLQSFEYASNADLELFEQLAEKGARVVILLSSEGLIGHVTSAKINPRTAPQEKPAKPPMPTLKRRWGIQVAYREQPRERNSFLPLFNRLAFVPAIWHFSSWTNDWMPSHMRDYSPLFLERPFGKGNVLLIANARLFTNRELLLKPDAQVLAAVPGDYRRIIFDESHLGLQDTGSVAGLASAHHLQWLLLGFIVLAVIFVWRSSFSFVPPPGRPPDEWVAGQDAGYALASLLAQSIPPGAVLNAVAEEWNRSRPLLTRSVHIHGGNEIAREQLAHLRGSTAEQAAAVYNELVHQKPSLNDSHMRG